MNADFKGDEYLYRAVWPNVFKKKNKRSFSTALFKSNDGCSVDRGYYRTDSEAIKTMKDHHLQGGFVKISVENCYKARTKPAYLPSKDNLYHSEIHGQSQIILDDEQRFDLGMLAIIVEYPE